jgi:hypothetical protein
MEERSGNFKGRCFKCSLKSEGDKKSRYYYCPVDNHNYHERCIPDQYDPIYDEDDGDSLADKCMLFINNYEIMINSQNES